MAEQQEKKKGEKAEKPEKEPKPERAARPEKGERQARGKQAPRVEVADEPEDKLPHRMPRMLDRYRSNVAPSLMKRFSFSNVMQVPKLEKIVVNMGVGRAIGDAKLLDEAVENLRSITGQQPLITKARKAISNFKLRQGQSIGAKVTLRGYRMYEFFDRLVSIALPRVRDFRGVPRKSFDGHGNYALGVKEQIVFHEINRDRISRITGFDVVFCTSADTDEHAMALLEELGMPFRKEVGA